MKASSDDRFRLADGISVRSLGDQGMLLRLGDGQMYTINQTALSFVEKADGQRSLADIVSMIADEFDVPPSQDLNSDIEALADDLLEEGLIIKADR